jgi:uncharacterized membrane protein
MAKQCDYDLAINTIARASFVSSVGGLLGLIIGIVLYAFGFFTSSLVMPLVLLVIGTALGLIYSKLTQRKVSEYLQTVAAKDVYTSIQKPIVWWIRPLLARGLWGRLLIPFLSAFFIILIIIEIKANSLVSSIGISALTLLLVLNGIREFYSTTETLQHSIEMAITQLMISLGNTLMQFIQEEDVDKSAKIRCNVMLYSHHEDKLFVRYSYNMSGDPDQNMALSKNQDVVGRTFISGRPMLMMPYLPIELGFSKEQIEIIPSNIKWKMAIPLLDQYIPFGVLAIDCNVAINMQVLDKVLDYSRGIATSLYILIAQYPSKVVQDALMKPEEIKHQ